jgi:hypothetical protein
MCVGFVKKNKNKKKQKLACVYQSAGRELEHQALRSSLREPKM